MEITLKVSPDQLKNAAEEIQNQITAFETKLKQMVQVIQGSKGYWTGDASAAHQKAFESLKEDVELVIRRLREHPDDLLKMAGLYEEAEKQAVEKSQALSGDVIF